MKRTFRVALASWCVAMAAAADAETFSFALIGDVPYNQFERAHLPLLLEEIGRENVAFVIHDGDIKDGGSPCSDEVFLDRLQLFNASRHPFILIPGDNEWTDCRRRSNGSYDPLERLAKLRELFFARGRTLGRNTFPLETQTLDPVFGRYRENVRWQKGRMLFVGLNIPGGDNNFGRGPAPSADFLERGNANRAWLASSFDLARGRQLAGIVIVIQANPAFEAYNRGSPHRGYEAFIDQLVAETGAFAGQVVLVHGDSHFHRIDKPMLAPDTHRVVERFTRVETYGSPFMGWVQVTVDDEQVSPFRFESRPYVVRQDTGSMQ
jgi:hypothetical protein